LSFNLLCRLSGLSLFRVLLLLKFKSDLVCTPCPGQLLHMNTIGPSRFRSIGGKWYVLVIVDNYSRYSWIFFLERNDEVFEHFQSLALRLNNEHPNCLKVIHNDNDTGFRNVSFDQFFLEHGVD
jgi:hypothetical protein